jgi:nucleobase:cation symporter-1, NCS1 family
VLRRRQLVTAELFSLDGRYSYENGINRRAMIALVAAVLPVVPGFLRAATTPGGQVADPMVFDTLYTYAWFVTFGLGFALHVVLHRPHRGVR